MSREIVACVASKPRWLQTAAQLLLAVQRFAVDQLEDERPGGVFSWQREWMIIHRFLLIHSCAFCV